MIDQGSLGIFIWGLQNVILTLKWCILSLSVIRYSLLRGDLNISRESYSDILTNCQSQTHSFLIKLPIAFDLSEGLKQASLLLAGHSNTSILDSYFNDAIIQYDLIGLNSYVNIALYCVLDRIRQQIDDDLLDSVAISHDLRLIGLALN